jgi:hypothetical protein
MAHATTGKYGKQVVPKLTAMDAQAVERRYTLTPYDTTHHLYRGATGSMVTAASSPSTTTRT